MNETPIIEWQAPEFIFYKKSADWFWVVIIITIALVVGSVLLKNFLASIIIGISGFSILMYGAKKPDIIDFSISPQGIQARNKLYLFENLEYFWINYNPPHTKQLILKSNKLLMTHLSIPLGNADPEVIQEILLQFIKEKKIEESFSEIISKFLKF
ncbi:MAG: hypothetical protein NUV64_01935 [Parcubacteria group bacterium]|nr:hypothetical protein [Parcubacteria group bacterium]MCR4342774.1 hypothetical protein [Patescibacteria group bacterium]